MVMAIEEGDVTEQHAAEIMKSLSRRSGIQLVGLRGDQEEFWMPAVNEQEEGASNSSGIKWSMLSKNADNGGDSKSSTSRESGRVRVCAVRSSGRFACG